MTARAPGQVVPGERPAGRSRPASSSVTRLRGIGLPALSHRPARAAPRAGQAQVPSRAMSRAPGLSSHRRITSLSSALAAGVGPHPAGTVSADATAASR